MPPISLLRAKDDAKKYGLEPEVVLKLKEKAMLARGVAYCMFCSFHESYGWRSCFWLKINSPSVFFSFFSYFLWVFGKSSRNVGGSRRPLLSIKYSSIISPHLISPPPPFFPFST